MLKRLTSAALAIALSAGAVASCSSGSSKSSSPKKSTSPTMSASPRASTTSPAPAVQLPHGDAPVRLDPGDFTTEIDNPYWPMKPGTRWTFRETDGEGGEAKVVVIVTGLTKKMANGITARVVRDTVSEDGQIVEDTYDWYAQDADGNIWYLGEDTAEFEDGKVSSRAGSFQAGVDGALPGIAVPASPQPGMEYRQEYYKGEAEDSGRVLSTDELAEVPAGRYRDALLTKDFTPLEPDVLEYKLYAKGVGPVLILTASGGAGREELLSVDQVTGSEGTGPLGKPNP
jgi:hypothetical protein